MAEKLTISAKEAAELLGVAPNTVYKMTHIKGFPARRIGGRVLISRKGLTEWVDKFGEIVFEEVADG